MPEGYWCAAQGSLAGVSANSLLPALSVVIPVYNEQNWIDRSVGALIASAQAANWPVEVVVVDDGSTDGTGDKLAELRELYGITVQPSRTAAGSRHGGRGSRRPPGGRSCCSTAA